MVLPMAIAKENGRAAKIPGTFQGLMTPMTPIGVLIAWLTLPFNEGRISPIGA